MCRFRALSLGFFLPWASAQRTCWRSKAIQYIHIFNADDCYGLPKPKDHERPTSNHQTSSNHHLEHFPTQCFVATSWVWSDSQGRKLRLDEHINHPRDKGESAGSDRHQNDDTWSHDPFSPIVLFGSQDSQELCSSTSPCLGKLSACYSCPFSYRRRNLAISRPH